MEIFSTNNKLSILLLFEQIGFSMMIVSFFPHVKSLGSTELYLGMIMSSTSLIGLVWNPIVGSLGDTYGRKFIYKRLIITNIFSYILLAMTNLSPVIFLSRIISAFGGPTVPTLTTLATEVLTKENQPSFYSRMPAIMAVSFILGSLTGGFLIEFNNGYQLCYILMVILNLINMGICSTLPSKKDENAKKNKKEEAVSIQSLVKKEVLNVVNKLTKVNWKQYSDIFSLKLCFELACILFYRSLGPSFIEYGVKGRGMGYVFTFMSVCTIIANVILIKLKKNIYENDKNGTKRLLHSASLFVGTAMILGFSPNIVLYSSGLIPLAFGRTIIDSTFTEILMSRATDKDRGGVSGAFESIGTLPGLLVPITAGILTDWYGHIFTLRLSLFPSLAGLLLAYKQK